MIQTLNLDLIEREPIDASTKGFPHGAPPIPLGEIGVQGWHLLKGSLPLPQAVLKDSALTHNHAWMRDFTRELKADPRTSGVPVVAVSAHALAQNVEKARAVGCAEYITKPITDDPFVFLDRLTRYVERAVGGARG